MVKFQLGKLMSTRRVYDRRMNDMIFDSFVWDSLAKYINCDWGDTCPEDSEMNDEAVKSGCDRILAVYIPKSGEKDKIWIITESDHSATTILFPDEY